MFDLEFNINACAVFLCRFNAVGVAGHIFTLFCDNKVNGLLQAVCELCEVFTVAKMLFAYGEATVPKVTVTVRKSYGGSHLVMGCKQLRADINYAWPSAEIAVMGPSGAVEVLDGKEIAAIADPAERAELVAKKEQDYRDKFANPYDAAKFGYIDDVIEPPKRSA